MLRGLTAVFALTKAVAAGVLDRGGGSVVNIASVYGLPLDLRFGVLPCR